MKRLKIKEKRLRRKRFLAEALGLIFFIFLALGVIRIRRELGKSVWDGRNKVNLVFQSESIFIASFDPLTKSLSFLVIPDETFIEAVHGYGPYRAESLKKLGEIEGYGGKLLAESLQEYLGIPIDGYLLVDGLALKNDSVESKNLVARSMVSLLKNGGETNLADWDLVRLWWKIKKLRGGQTVTFNLAEMSAFSEVILPDGSRAAEVDPERLEKVVSRLFVDERIRNENLAIAVLNGTTYAGLAGRAAKLVSHMGGRVVAVGEIEETTVREALKEKKCQIQSPAKYKKTYTVKKLGEIFGCRWIGEKLYQQRAEVVLIIAEGYWQKLYLLSATSSSPVGAISGFSS